MRRLAARTLTFHTDHWLLQRSFEHERAVGIQQADAINMVNAVVAKHSRQVLITACASYRDEKNNEVLMELLKLAGLTTALPLPEHSAQAEMVAAGIQQSASLPERQVPFSFHPL